MGMPNVRLNTQLVARNVLSMFQVHKDKKPKQKVIAQYLVRNSKLEKLHEAALFLAERELTDAGWKILRTEVWNEDTQQWEMQISSLIELPR
jgi:hypothetical protein